MDLLERSRRLRGTPILRELVRETRCSKSSLIYPMFVKEGTNIKEEIPSMQGQYRYSPDTLLFELEHLSNIGISSVMLFGIPNHKDAYASGAYAQDGVIQTALQLAKKEFPNLYYITDVCLCEYTSHGHCGMLCGETVDNDSTLPVLAKTALSHVQAGADMVAPSDMMDGRILALRHELDKHGYTNTPITLLRSTDHFVTQQAPLLHSATERPIRWITIIERKLSKKQNRTLLKELTSLW